MVIGDSACRRDSVRRDRRQIQQLIDQHRVRRKALAAIQAWNSWDGDKRLMVSTEPHGEPGGKGE